MPYTESSRCCITFPQAPSLYARLLQPEDIIADYRQTNLQTQLRFLLHLSDVRIGLSSYFSLIDIHKSSPNPLHAPKLGLCLDKCVKDDKKALLAPQVYKAEAYPWITAALAAIPEQAATDADKQNLLKAAQDLASGIDNRW